MKRILAISLALLLLFSLCACGSSEEAAPEALRIISLKGPTTMGLVNLYAANEAGESKQKYDVSMVTAADEVTAALISGTADIAALPANAAATLFNKKGGGFSVIAINTLGVLQFLENGESIQSFEDLRGKTLVLTGKGSTPEYALRHLLDAYGMEESVQLEFKSEATEVVSYLADNAAAIALLPQPFVTAALAQNENLRIALDLNDEWQKLDPNSAPITGVTVARTEISEKYPEAIQTFLDEYADSAAKTESDPEGTAALIESYGIVAKAALAQKALPSCHIVCISGSEMQKELSGYLQTLFDANPDAIGGKMPADSFYYIP